jgi:VCBS repeat-containing protein
LSGSVLAGAGRDLDPDADSLTVTPAPSSPPAYGSVSLAADGAFTYTYTGTVPAPSAADSFGYTIHDGFSGTAQGSVTILLNGQAAAATPTAPASLSASDASIAAGASSVFAAELRWPAATDDVEVTGYNVYRDGALHASVPSAAPGATVSYIDTATTPDTTHAYHVTALDGTGESPPSSSASVTIVPSLRQNIQTGWGAGTDPLWQASGCTGCHRGAAGGMTLRGTADQVFLELTEAASDAGQRIDSASPLQSLLLCKPLVWTSPDKCYHEGGDFLPGSDPKYRLLMRWIAGGAPNN